MTPGTRGVSPCFLATWRDLPRVARVGPLGTPGASPHFLRTPGSTLPRPRAARDTPPEHASLCEPQGPACAGPADPPARATRDRIAVHAGQAIPFLRAQPGLRILVTACAGQPSPPHARREPSFLARLVRPTPSCERGDPRRGRREPPLPARALWREPSSSCARGVSLPPRHARREPLPLLVHAARATRFLRAGVPCHLGQKPHFLRARGDSRHAWREPTLSKLAARCESPGSCARSVFSTPGTSHTFLPTRRRRLSPFLSVLCQPSTPREPLLSCTRGVARDSPPLLRTRAAQSLTSCARGAVRAPRFLRPRLQHPLSRARGPAIPWARSAPAPLPART